MDILGSLCDIPLTVVFAVGCIVLIYIYGKKKNQILKDAGFVGPEPTIYVGNIFQMASKGFMKALSEYNKKYGKVYGLYIGAYPTVTVTDLDILKEVFVKDSSNFSERLNVDLQTSPISKGMFFEHGVTWKRVRSLCSPTFSAGKLKLMCHRMSTCADTLVENLSKIAKEEGSIEVKKYFGAFTMDVIASTAFGVGVDSQNNDDNPFVYHAKEIFKGSVTESPAALLSLMFPSLCPIFKFMGIEFFPKTSVKFFVDTISDILEERKRRPLDEKSVDFLQLLADAEVESSSKATSEDLNVSSKKQMTRDEIIGQAFLFFIAGYDTTATSLSFTAYSLATHPDVQDKVRSEIQSVLGDADPTYENIAELKYLENVINESLRLFPPIPGISRMVENNVTIKGYTIQKGMAVQVPVLQLHMDPDIYPDPEEFKPERWDDPIENIAFLPFGFGPRMCIGMRLAIVELKIALVQIIRKMKILRLPETPDKLEFTNQPILSPTIPIKVKLQMV